MLGRMQRILGYPRGRNVGIEEEIYAAQLTANVLINQTVEASAVVIFAGTELHFDGLTPHIFEVFCPLLSCGADSSMVIYLFEDGLSIGELARVRADSSSAVTSSASHPVMISHRRMPKGGRHTYSIRGIRGTSNQNWNAGPGGTAQFLPSYYRILRVGGVD